MADPDVPEAGGRPCEPCLGRSEGAGGGRLRVLVAEGGAAITVRRSRFFAYAAPAANAPEVLAPLLASVRGRHRDAGHVVYAWRGRDGAARSNDDGEPAGTGGRPLLAVLERAGLTDSAVAVARVFGGVLLGAAGLARAYGEAAAQAVAQAPVRTLRPVVAVRAQARYADQPALEAVLAGALVDAVRTFDAEGMTLAGEVLADRVAALAAALSEATRGRVRLTASDVWRWR